MIMTTTNRLLSASILALLFIAPGTAWGAADTQSYTVTVDAVLTIAAPVAATITHDTTDASQAFTAQAWTVNCNDPQGGSVSFAVSAPFVHTTVAAYKADVQLDLAISSSEAAASWTVTTASDVTDYSAGTPDNAAQVASSSTAAGDVSYALSVSFVQSDYSILAAGDYAVTVTGTLTAN